MANEKRLIYSDVLYETIENFEATSSDGALTISEIAEFIEAQPTVDAVEVVRGRWREKILVGGFTEEWGYVCSECGCTVSDRSNIGIGRYARNNQRLNYCPNCGAKMDGVADG